MEDYVSVDSDYARFPMFKDPIEGAVAQYQILPLTALFLTGSIPHVCKGNGWVWENVRTTLCPIMKAVIDGTVHLHGD